MANLTSKEWSRLRYFMEELPPKHTEPLRDYVGRLEVHTKVDLVKLYKDTCTDDDSVTTMLAMTGFQIDDSDGTVRIMHKQPSAR